MGGRWGECCKKGRGDTRERDGVVYDGGGGGVQVIGSVRGEQRTMQRWVGYMYISREDKVGWDGRGREVVEGGVEVTLRRHDQHAVFLGLSVVVPCRLVISQGSMAPLPMLAHLTQPLGK